MTTETTQLVDIDPTTTEENKRKAEAIQSKIDRTGLTESYCYSCEDTLPIERFTIHRTGSKRNKGKKSTKLRKNTPITTWSPRRECNKCLIEKKKTTGQYDKDLANKRKIYKSNEALKKSLREAAIRARATLADSYIRKLLKADGYTAEQIKDDPKLIKKKRKEVKDKRDSAANKTYETRKNTGFYAKRERAELRPTYLKRCIRASKGYNGEEITEEMLTKKKAELLHERANGDKLWVTRKTLQQKMANKKAVSDNRIKILDNVYIKSRIKHCVWYKGGEITDEMIEKKREEILKSRGKKELGIPFISKADRLTNGYIRDLIARAKGGSRKKITQADIDLKREQILERRIRLVKEGPLKKIKEQERKEKKERREDLMLLASIKRAQEKIRLWREKEQRELAQKEEKERKKLLKKERKATAKKSKRLEKKLQKQQKTTPYTFFVSHELRA